MPNKSGLRAQEDILDDILKGQSTNQQEKQLDGKRDVRTILKSNGELIRKLKEIEADIKASPSKIA
ncbi:hypothetical protein Q8G50_32565, partial [Klebsiella pneumoniae]